MRSHEALQYLPSRQLNPSVEVECASAYCAKTVQLAHARAYPAMYTDGTVQMAFFCSETCLTAVMCGGRC